MADRALLLYRGRMDYTEIQSFYGYDMEKAHEAALMCRAEIEEELQRVGLEALEPKSRRPDSRGLHDPVDMRGDGA